MLLTEDKKAARSKTGKAVRFRLDVVEAAEESVGSDLVETVADASLFEEASDNSAEQDQRGVNDDENETNLTQTDDTMMMTVSTIHDSFESDVCVCLTKGKSLLRSYLAGRLLSSTGDFECDNDQDEPSVYQPIGWHMSLPPTVSQDGEMVEAAADVLNVILASRESITFKFDRETRVRDVLRALKSCLRIRFIEHFGLAVQTNESVATRYALLDETRHVHTLAERYGVDCRCYLRFVFVPASYTLLVADDPTSLDYLYEQCANDAVFERHRASISFDLWLHLTTLTKLNERFTSLAASIVAAAAAACSVQETEVAQIQSASFKVASKKPANPNGTVTTTTVSTATLPSLSSDPVELGKSQIQAEYLQYMNEIALEFAGHIYSGYLLRNSEGDADGARPNEHPDETFVVIGAMSGIGLLHDLKTKSV